MRGYTSLMPLDAGAIEETSVGTNFGLFKGLSYFTQEMHFMINNKY